MHTVTVKLFFLMEIMSFCMFMQFVNPVLEVAQSLIYLGWKMEKLWSIGMLCKIFLRNQKILMGCFNLLTTPSDFHYNQCIHDFQRKHSSWIPVIILLHPKNRCGQSCKSNYLNHV